MSQTAGCADIQEWNRAGISQHGHQKITFLYQKTYNKTHVYITYKAFFPYQEIHVDRRFSGSVKTRTWRYGRGNWRCIQHPTAFYNEDQEAIPGHPDQSSSFQANGATTKRRWKNNYVQLHSGSKTCSFVSWPAIMICTQPNKFIKEIIYTEVKVVIYVESFIPASEGLKARDARRNPFSHGDVG